MLPAAGREGPAPDWPLSRPLKREIVLWEREWARPQAVMWERNGQDVEVAMYVRSLVAAESRKATVATRTLVRQQQEALGLSLPGLARNHWRIMEGDLEPASSDTRQRRTPSGGGARNRFKVVPGGAGKT
jgi:hypothetical protein